MLQARRHARQDGNVANVEQRHGSTQADPTRVRRRPVQQAETIKHVRTMEDPVFDPDAIEPYIFYSAKKARVLGAARQPSARDARYVDAYFDGRIVQEIASGNGCRRRE